MWSSFSFASEIYIFVLVIYRFVIASYRIGRNKIPPLIQIIHKIEISGFGSNRMGHPHIMGFFG